MAEIRTPSVLPGGNTAIALSPIALGIFEGQGSYLVDIDTTVHTDSCTWSVPSKCFLSCTDIYEFGGGGRQHCWYSPPSLHPHLQGLTSARSAVPVLSDSTQNEKVPLVPQEHLKWTPAEQEVVTSESWSWLCSNSVKSGPLFPQSNEGPAEGSPFIH